MKRYIIIISLILGVFLLGNIKVYSLEKTKEINNYSLTEKFFTVSEVSIEGDLSKGMTKVIEIIKYFYDILIVLVPIALLLFGTFDLVKAVASQDEKAIKAAQSSVGRRIMWAFIALSAMLIFRLVMSLVVGGNDWKAYW